MQDSTRTVRARITDAILLILAALPLWLVRDTSAALADPSVAGGAEPTGLAGGAIVAAGGALLATVLGGLLFVIERERRGRRRTRRSDAARALAHR